MALSTFTFPHYFYYYPSPPALTSLSPLAIDSWVTAPCHCPSPTVPASFWPAAPSAWGRWPAPYWCSWGDPGFPCLCHSRPQGDGTDLNPNCSRTLQTMAAGLLPKESPGGNVTSGPHSVISCPSRDETGASHTCSHPHLARAPIQHLFLGELLSNFFQVLETTRLSPITQNLCGVLFFWSF